MHRFVVLTHSMLKNNYTGLLVHGNDIFDTAGFGVGRTHELHIPLQWLYEKYPRDKAAVLWETMELMIAGGVVWGADWRTFWKEGVYPAVYYDTTPFDLQWVFLHGVNMAEGMYMNNTYLDTLSLAVDYLHCTYSYICAVAD